jgi:hypothetical protein
MPQQTDHPTAIGSDDAWGLGAGGTKMSAVSTDDGDTSYIGMSFGTFAQSFVMPDLPSAAGSVTAVAENGIVKKQQNVGTNQVGLRYNGTTYTGLSNVTLTYTQINRSWDTNLTVALVNSGQSGIQGFDTAGGDNRCTELWRVTDYQLAPAGYFFIMGSLLGAALQLSDFAAAVDYFNHCERVAWKAWQKPSMTTILPAEIVPAFADVKAYRAPHFVFLGRA